MVTSVEEIVTIVARYAQVEALYQSRVNTTLKQEYERHLVRLYKHIIRYQISATCYYRQNTMRESYYIILLLSLFWANKDRSPLSTGHTQARRPFRGDGSHSATRWSLSRYQSGF